MFDSDQRREAVDRLLAEHRELTARLSDPAVHQDPALARRLNRRFAELGAVVTAHRAWSAAAEELADARELAAAGDDDAAAFAAEVPGLEAAEAEAAERLRRLLIPRDPDDARDVILEIKGGEGGEVDHDAGLVVGGAAAVPAGGAIGGRALGQGERIGFPSLAVAGRHHVIVGVQQHRLGAFIALALTQDGRGAIGRGDGFHADSRLFQCGLNPLACALGLVLQTFLVVDGVKGHELAELAENGLAIVANAFIKCSHVFYGTRPPQAIEQPE